MFVTHIKLSLTVGNRITILCAKNINNWLVMVRWLWNVLRLQIF